MVTHTHVDWLNYGVALLRLSGNAYMFKARPFSGSVSWFFTVFLFNADHFPESLFSHRVGHIKASLCACSFSFKIVWLTGVYAR